MNRTLKRHEMRSSRILNDRLLGLCAGCGNGQIKATPHIATGSEASRIIREGSRTAPRLTWAMQACGQMNTVAGTLLLSATETKVSGSLSVLMEVAS